MKNIDAIDLDGVVVPDATVQDTMSLAGDPALLRLGPWELPLSVLGQQCLVAMGIRTIGELIAMTETELLKGLGKHGRRVMMELPDVLSEHGLSFGER